MVQRLKTQKEFWLIKQSNGLAGFTEATSQSFMTKRAVSSFVKRIIGLPGDSIKMKNDQLYINDKKVEEPYLKEYKQDTKESGVTLTGDFEVEVPTGKYFVMGDNRLNSLDSRNGMGMPSEDDIIGTESLVFYPFGEMRQAK